ncbi:MAG: beta strand repeat-containing protein, partial [Sulfuriferula sp.]
ALGKHGYITYGANGAAYEVDYAANGTYTTISQDGHGDLTDTFFDASGTETGDSWKTANGAHGSDTYNADGSSSGTSYNADGSYGSYTDDGKGDMVSAEYLAAGVMLSEVWTNANDTSGNETFNADGSTATTNYNADGSYTVTNNDGKGDIFQTDYTATGVKTSDAWQKANGTKGSDTFFAPGSVYNLLAEGQTTNPDGSSSQYQTILNSSNLVETDTTFYASGGVVSGTSKSVNNGNGTATVNSYSASGTLTETMTDTLSSAGAVTSDTWTKADGSSGSDTFHADGSSSGTTINTDGSTSAYANDGQGDITTDSYKASGVLSAVAWSSGDPYVTTTSSTNAAGSVTTTSTNAQDHSSILTTTNTDGSSVKAISDGKGDTTTDNYSASNVLTSDSWTQANGTSGSDAYNADGSSSSTVNDGQGDSTTDNYSANGVLMSDSWSKADGSHGSDTYNTNGSSSSTSYNADGSYTTTSDDGQGDVTTDRYSSSGTLQSDSWIKADGTIGTDTYNANGSVASSTSYNPTQKTLNPFLSGNTSGVQVQNTDNQYGNVIADTWTAPDGTYGADSYQSRVFGNIWPRPINYGTGIKYNSNGSYSSYQINQSQGTLWIGNYTTGGALQSDIYENNIGFSGAVFNYGWDTYHADGSVTGFERNQYESVTYTYDGKGGYNYTLYSASGIKIADAWQSDHGGIGLDVYNQGGVNYSVAVASNGAITSNLIGQVSTPIGQYADYQPPGSNQEFQVGGGTTGASPAISFVDRTSGQQITIEPDLSGIASTNDFNFNNMPDPNNPNAGGDLTFFPSDYTTGSQYLFLNPALVAGSGNSINLTPGSSDVYAAPWGDTWTSSNGAHGVDYFTNPSSYTDLFYGGQTSFYLSPGLWGDAHIYYAADGSEIKTSVDDLSNVNTVFLAANGSAIGGLSVNANGEIINMTSGAFNEVEYYADGSNSVYVSDGSGNVTATYSNVTGINNTTNTVIEYWSQSDGSWGNNISYLFGGQTHISNTAHNPDGSSSIKNYVGGVLSSDSWTDASGNSGTDTYSAGILASDFWKDANGSSGSDTYNSTGVLTWSHWTNASGSGGSNFYSSAGTLTETTWTNADGSFGSTTYNADGSYATSATTATGNTSTDNYTAAGVLTSDT